MKKLPVLLITGFLGAGKTTFLNELLIYLNEQKKSVALLINEFGKTNIDKKLVGPEADTIYEVNQGSIFCVCTRDQFIKALDSIATHSPAFDVAVIESTGIANTRDIGVYLDTPPLNELLDIKQNFCLIDAANFHKVYTTLPAVKTQVEEASLCIVNKIDLVENDYMPKLKEKINRLNSTAPIIETEFGKVEFSKHLNLNGHWDTKWTLDVAPLENISSITFSSTGTFSKEKVHNLLNRHRDSLLRVKGFLNTADGFVYVEWVGDSFFSKPSKEETLSVSQLVLIGYNLDEENIKIGFTNCVKL
ncbi:MAG: GTP-binding protein [Clostridiales bacterium]|nr:GTP-binding protein [Clostridiales bacterium]